MGLTLTAKLISELYAKGKLTTEQVMLCIDGKFIDKTDAKDVLKDDYVEPEEKQPIVNPDEIERLVTDVIKSTTYTKKNIDDMLKNFKPGDTYTKEQIEEMFKNIGEVSFPNRIECGQY